MEKTRNTRIGGIQKQLFQSNRLIDSYRSTAVGSKGVGVLVYYETVCLLADFVPGPIGERLRRVLYAPLFGKIGRGVRFCKYIVFRHPHKIFIGEGVSLGDFVCLNVKGQGQAIVIADRGSIGAETIFSCSGAAIRIGCEGRIGRKCRIGSLKGVQIGANFKMGDECCIVGAAHVYDQMDIPIIEQALTCKAPTRIGDNVTIGNRVTILDGAVIGDNAVIEDGALVNRTIPDDARGAGVPVRLR